MINTVIYSQYRQIKYLEAVRCAKQFGTLKSRQVSWTSLCKAGVRHTEIESKEKSTFF